MYCLLEKLALRTSNQYRVCHFLPRCIPATPEAACLQQPCRSSSRGCSHRLCSNLQLSQASPTATINIVAQRLKQKKLDKTQNYAPPTYECKLQRFSARLCVSQCMHAASNLESRTSLMQAPINGRPLDYVSIANIVFFVFKTHRRRHTYAHAHTCTCTCTCTCT